MRVFVLGSFVQACCWSVSRIPAPGETLQASAVHIEAGGKGLNVAIGTRRLGAQVDIALGVGQDPAAESLKQKLNHEGIGIAHVHALAASSGYGAGMIAESGQNAIAVYPGPNLLLNASHMHAASSQIAQADIVYGQFETSLEAISTAFSIGHQHQKTTVLNPSPWQTIPADILKYTDVLIVNEIEAGYLFANDNSMRLDIDCSQDIQKVLTQLKQAALSFFRNWQGKLLVVTLGEFGSAAFTAQDEMHYAPSLPIEVKDTIGAGDAFASGFCVALLKHLSLSQALHYGNACGAIVASQHGVLEALQSVDLVEAFLANKQTKKARA